MVKTKTVETIEEYDENGKLIKKTVTETEETDDSPVRYPYSYPVWTPTIWEPYCKTTCESEV